MLLTQESKPPSKYEQILLTRKSRAFKSTNRIWNEMGLNHGWIIGYISQLFKTNTFSTYIEWERFYYESGRQRLEQIRQLPEEKQAILKNREATPAEIRSVTNEERLINTQYGRTNTELCEIGYLMYQQIKREGNPYHISLRDSIEFVKIRVLNEIFIGMKREQNTIRKLQFFFPNAEFREVPIYIDTKYAVDYEVYYQNRRVLALQIKSRGYKANQSAILQTTKSYNKKKNYQYTKEFGVDVLYVYADEQGLIEDKQTLQTILSYLAPFSREVNPSRECKINQPVSS